MEDKGTILLSARGMWERSAEIYEYQKNHPEEDLYSICWAVGVYTKNMRDLAKNEPFKSYYGHYLDCVLKPFRFANDYTPTDKAIRSVLENHPEWSDCFEEVGES